MTYFLELMFNLALLVALSVVSGFVEKRWDRQTLLGQLWQGVLFGATAVIGMLHPLVLGPGLIIDGRSVMISLCAFFFGPWAVAVAGSLAILCRIGLGGIGALTGVLVILSSAGIGLLAHYRLKPEATPPSVSRLFLFGVVVQAVMVVLMFTLPGGIGLSVIKRIGLPVMLIYPLATILVGKILSDQILAVRTMSDLVKTKQNLDVTLRSIGDAVISTDLKGEIVLMNAVAEVMTGWSQAEACGRPLGEVYRLAKGENWQKSDNSVVRTLFEKQGVVKSSDTLLFAKDGTRHYVADSTAPIFGLQGESVGVVLVFRDQTEQRKLEAQFRQAQKMESVGRLAGGVAHDYNNMLAVILGYADLALCDVTPSEPLHDYLQEIRAAATRSTEVTRQLLAFARKQEIAPRVIDLNEVVGGMLKMLRRLIGEDIDLIWRPMTDLKPVLMDPTQLDQILANLCVNARDAINGNGKVSLETRGIIFDEDYCADHVGFVPGEFILLAVSDDGCGMDKETQAKAFEPFFTTKGVGVGTGLGMSTVYGIVKQNNGFLNVYSEPGKGTTVKIYLPVSEGAVGYPLERGAEELQLGSGETILVVEDEIATLTLCKTMLEKLGYRVMAANSPEEALQLAAGGGDEICLLVSDVVMPGVNGRELSERLVTIHPNLKLLFMSGYTANAIVHRGMLEEGVFFIQKPFSINDLAAKVREVLASEPLRVCRGQ